MQMQSVTACYFSATDTTRRGVMAMAEVFEKPIHSIDLTSLQDYQPACLEADTLAIFGAPVYGGRVPEVAIERFRTLQGKGTPCVVTVTYGNRDYDDALLELCDLAKEQGFLPIAAAALIGQHNFGHVATGRPSKEDLVEDRLFAARVRGRLAGWQTIPDKISLTIKGNRPYKEGGKGGRFRPQTEMESCTQCGVCAKVCPTGAVDPEDVGKIDDAKCLSCFRCIRLCPTGAKHPHTEAYDSFAADFTEKLWVRRENEYIL